MSNYIINTNSKQITFLDNRFYAIDDGQFIPSVTTILQAYPKDAHFYSWLKEVGKDADTIRDQAGKRGSAVHEMTERYDAGEEVSLLDNFGQISYSTAEWAMFERYVQFRAENQIDIIHSEFNITSPKQGFAGTIDRIIQMNDVNYLIDIKTSNTIYDHYWCQLAAYKKLMQEHYGSMNVVDKVAILWLNAKTRTSGKGGAIQGIGWQLIIRDENEEENDWELFQATHKLWLAQNKDIKPKNINYALSHKL